jgi:hypothetical protein
MNNEWVHIVHGAYIMRLVGGGDGLSYNDCICLFIFIVTLVTNGRRQVLH